MGRHNVAGVSWRRFLKRCQLLLLPLAIAHADWPQWFLGRIETSGLMPWK